MKKASTYNIIHTFKQVFHYLPARRRMQFWLLAIVMVFSSGVETVALGSIAFFVFALSHPASALKAINVKVSALHLVNFIGTLHSINGMIVMVSILVLFFIVIKNLTRGFISYYNTYYSAHCGAYIGSRIMEGFLYMPYEWHLSRNSADLCLAVYWRQFFSNFLSSVLQILNNCVLIIVLLTTILIVDPVVSLVIIFFVGASALVIFVKVRGKLDHTLETLKNYRQSINRDVAKALHGVKDVKVLGRESFFLKNFSNDVKMEAGLTTMQRILSQCPPWLLEVVGFVMLVSSILLMLFYMHNSMARITGVIALIAVTAWRILPSAGNILSNLTNARLSLPYMKNGLHYLSIIDLETVHGYGQDGMDARHDGFDFQESIRVENLRFTYAGSDAPVLNGMDFTIKKGMAYGIIGISGAGKSTIADILIGLLPPAKGRIMIDGQELVPGNFSAWRRLVGYVPQAPYICDGSVCENIAFGSKPEDIDRNRVEECCSMAAMDDFVHKLPKGIDTLIGERGVKLSGGQRQRVAIARALYHSPEVLIFDEATSSLDKQSEKAIQNTIYSLKGKHTLIVIAHRLSTVEDCDEVVWVEEGTIHRIGSSSEILPAYRLRMENPVTQNRVADEAI